MLGTIVAAIVKVTSKVAIWLYVHRMMLTATMAEYELEVAHSAPHIIVITRTIGLVVKPGQSKVATRAVELLA